MSNYAPIRPIPDDHERLARDELRALGDVWRDRKDALEREGDLDTFLLRLRREWAIETGIIERLYDWDRGVTELLIKNGIDAATIAHRAGLSETGAQRATALIRDQYDIIDGLFDFVKGERQLTEQYVRSLHQHLTRNQDSTTDWNEATGQLVEVPLVRGRYKERPNNPRRRNGTLHTYCPPLRVQDEMERLLRWYGDASTDVAPEVLAAWLHHRFTRIHPFQDGNGRVARALASLVFLRSQLFPLLVRDRDRETYIHALESADAGDLAPLVGFFAQRQRETILGALGVERRAEHDRRVDRLIEAGVQTLQQRARTVSERVERVEQTAASLQSRCHERLSEVATRLDASISELGQDFHAASTRSEDDNAHWYYRQIVDTAKDLAYYANLDYRAWAALVVRTETPFYLVVSFHGLGYQPDGLLVASAFTFRRVPDADDDTTTDVVDRKAATNELFQFNYAETVERATTRFEDWLEEVLVVGLEQWRRAVDAE